jgi:cell fate (sporulation/competence/biofilm development) regulator YmcA (YheA/YmcA/DUF963 family)
MENVMNLIRKRTVCLSLLGIFVAGAFLWAGDGGLLSKQELKTHIADAKTAQDHERLAQHFDAKADELEAEAKEHQELAAQYKAHPTIHEMKHQMSGQTAGHCQYFADELHKAAMGARQMATDHREMAREAK